MVRPTRVLTSAALLGALVIAGIVFWYFSNSDRGVLSEKLVLVESDAGPWYDVGTLGMFGFRSVLPEYEGRIVDYTQRGDVVAAIIDVDGAQHVQVRVGGGEWEVIDTSADQKATLALSADGEALAYAVRNTVDRIPEDILSWEIQIYDISGGKLFALADGYAPYFVPFPERGEGAEVLFFSTPSGLGAYEPIVNEISFYTTLAPPSTEYPAYFSSDGKYVTAYDTSAVEQIIFEVTQTLPLEISVVGTAPELISAGFVGSVLIGIPYPVNTESPGVFVLDIPRSHYHRYDDFGSISNLVGIVQ